jgi:hypothetical protein
MCLASESVSDLGERGKIGVAPALGSLQGRFAMKEERTATSVGATRLASLGRASGEIDPMVVG